MDSKLLVSGFIRKLALSVIRPLPTANADRWFVAGTMLKI